MDEQPTEKKKMSFFKPKKIPSSKRLSENS